MPDSDFTPVEINRAHFHSDVDTAVTAQHHTLGYAVNQAAPGSAVNKRITALESLNSVFAIASASAALTLTTANQDVAGCSVTINVGKTSETYAIVGIFDFNVSVAASSVAIGELMADGVIQTSQALFLSTSSVNRGTVAQVWTVTGLAAGNRIFKLQARKSAALGTISATNIHTRIFVVRLN